MKTMWVVGIYFSTAFTSKPPLPPPAEETVLNDNVRAIPPPPAEETVLNDNVRAIPLATDGINTQCSAPVPVPVAAAPPTPDVKAYDEAVPLAAHASNAECPVLVPDAAAPPAPDFNAHCDAAPVVANDHGSAIARLAASALVVAAEQMESAARALETKPGDLDERDPKNADHSPTTPTSSLSPEQIPSGHSLEAYRFWQIVHKGAWTQGRARCVFPYSLDIVFLSYLRPVVAASST